MKMAQKANLVNLMIIEFLNKIQVGSKRCIHFIIIAIISYRINPCFCFPGKS